MTERKTAAVILAAGKGTRMASDLPKVLHPLGGRPMLHHLLATLEAMEVDRRILVLGAERERVIESLGAHDLEIAVQEPQRGTGHAVMQAQPALEGFRATILVLYGDTPLVTVATLERLRAAIEGGAGIAVLGFRPEDPAEYGRLVLDDSGGLARIVEAGDADAAERAIGLCNSGVMAFDSDILPRLLATLDDGNAKGEYYLTDTVAAARSSGRSVAVIEAPSIELLGVNSRADLAAAEAVFQHRARMAAMQGGATLVAPETVHFSFDTVLGRDVRVEPHVVFGPGVRIGAGAVIRAFSHLEGAVVESGAEIGPFARLRPGARIGEGAKVGNFVEVKKATLAAGAKANHLSYIGDAAVGAGANIGAGTITCNYDGFAKHHTEIGEGAFIGSNSALIAPVTIGRGAVVGAGSAITKDVPDDALALTRAPQETRDGWAARVRRRKAGRDRE